MSNAPKPRQPGEPSTNKPTPLPAPVSPPEPAPVKPAKAAKE